MATQYERQTAYLVDIGTLLGSQFVKGEAQMQPSYVATKSGRKMSRVHIIAVVVAIGDGIQAEATIDDGSGKLVARSFDNSEFFKGVQLGDMIRIIGKVRAFNEQVYLIPEVMKKINNKMWVDYHKLKLQRVEKVEEAIIPDIDEEVVDDELPIDADEEVSNNPSDDIINCIKELDSGDGAQIEVVIEKKGGETEKIIKNLLETGEVFEIRPGRIKVLD
ncbi:hypothetical protein COV16_03335 [Candidatus Woesearchaeota archaeon CG10_big_fil_rev_8_21_14_0_10_34_8]|nr:MAG: hypothetical protein COV16_03335 [Candidatus Woesearchaeota archaeon CG10_big_fil_rev_8_21_14_0_10_34_8]